MKKKDKTEASPVHDRWEWPGVRGVTQRGAIVKPVCIA